MKKLLVIFLVTIISNISLAQSGWGYVNYTSYKTHAGNGNTSQYPQFANNATDFVNMFNTANSNTTITHTGQTTLAAMADGSSSVPRWASDYFGYKFEFWFIPQETGTYKFGINSDDASDLSVNGNIISTYYGGHGASSYQYGSIDLIAGNSYYIVARMQEFGGGEAFYFRWSRPSAPSTYSYWTNEVTNVANQPIKKAVINFNFNTIVDATKFQIGTSLLNGSGFIDVTNMLDTVKVGNQYKTQSVTLSTTNDLSSLYNSIVTVSDVYLAFKELANGGIFGNEIGNEFGYGLQYMNSDIDGNKQFNEADCFILLQHLTGVKSIVDTFKLNNTLKLISNDTLNLITKSNWNTFPIYLGSKYDFQLSSGNKSDTFNVSVGWKGDVNLSHSRVSQNNLIGNSAYGIKAKTISNEINASILTEIVGDSVYAYITLDPLQQSVVGTQFQLKYDNVMLKFSNVKFTTKGAPMNYVNNTGTYVNIGSLIKDGIYSLDNTTEYKIAFLAKEKLKNVLGLISIGETDAVNKNGSQLKIKIN